MRSESEATVSTATILTEMKTYLSSILGKLQVNLW